MRVLLVEDEPATASSIQMMLSREGFNVFVTSLGEDAPDLCKRYSYDIILLDLILPGIHGYDVLKRLRVSGVQSPVLILSGISQTYSKVCSFRFGADDYLSKPFHRAELVARIRALVRRMYGHSQSIIRIGRLAINLETKTVDADGTRIHLTAKEFAMLELLALRRGTTVDKAGVLDHLYDSDNEPELKAIDALVCKLRKKLAYACKGEAYVQTVSGRGYVLLDPLEQGLAA